MIAFSEKPFHIYRSSAGSGKTYTLAKTYLKLALQSPHAFKRILGVTFTNKATAEMKQRILLFLDELSAGKNESLANELGSELSLSNEKLSDLARDLRSRILHGYHQFAIVTIDSFFHQVIRSFAREIGLQGSFSLNLDTKTVLETITNQMLEKLGDDKNKKLLLWLTRFAEMKMNDGKSWDFRNDTIKLASQLFSDEFKPHSQEVLALDKKEEFFVCFIGELDVIISSFEALMKRTAKECIEKLASKGLNPRELNGKGRGPGMLFVKMADGLIYPTDANHEAYHNQNKWLNKTDLTDASRFELIVNFVIPLYQSLLDTYNKGLAHYQSAIEIKKHFYTYGILSALNSQLEEFRDQEDTLLISDLPELLKRIINDSDTPYIFEKVGSRYDHFLIDEFQDTSFYQWDNFKPLIKNNTDSGLQSMIVGDAKQSIYRWRGGNWQLLQNKAGHDMGNHHSEVIPLLDNWRSSPDLVNFNNDFFQKSTAIFSEIFKDFLQNKNRDLSHFLGVYEDIQQVPKNKHPGHVHIQYIQNDETEKWKEKAIKETIIAVENAQSKGYQLKDIAILTRGKSEGKLIADAFMAYTSSPAANPNYKYDIVSSEVLFLTSGISVCLLISTMEWLQNEKNLIAKSEWTYFYRILTKNLKADNPFEHWREFSTQSPESLHSQKHYLKSLPVFELTESLIRIFKLNDYPEEFTYLQGFQDAVLDYSKNERGDIASFLDWWETAKTKRTVSLSDQNNAINILTIHKSKGLEFPIVIIPFLSWGLDHGGGKENILWVKPVPHSPFDKLPIIPLNYHEGMDKTYWSTEYRVEKINAFIDNLNLLYVAFTRAKIALYAFGEIKKEMKLSSVGDLTYHIVKNREEWEGESLKFQIGEIPAIVKNDEVNREFTFSHYAAFPWRSKVALQLKNEIAQTQESREAQRWGIQLHKDLGKLKTLEDLYRLEDSYLKRELKLIVNHEDIEPFFNGVSEVKIEVPILLPGGESRRIDRLVKKNNEWWVVDFKTGKHKSKNNDQVKKYMAILDTMGYQSLRGFLVYLDPVMVEEVAI